MIIYVCACVRVCFNFCYPFDCSYKLWYNYLRERRKQVKGKCVTEPSYEEVNNCHERALVFMHKVTLLLSKYPPKNVRIFPQKLTSNPLLFSRCPEYGSTTASFLCLKARLQEAGKHLTARFELFLSLSIRASGHYTFALSAICLCLRQPSGCTAGTSRWERV